MVFETILLVTLLSIGAIAYLGKLFYPRHKRLFRSQPISIHYCKKIFPLLFVFTVIYAFVAEPYRIPSASLSPTLLAGDFIVVDKYSHGLRLPISGHRLTQLGSPKRGDVAICRTSPEISSGLNRIIGLPGDHIQYVNQHLLVNGTQIEQLLPTSQPSTLALQKTPPANNSLTVPDNAYFVLSNGEGKVISDNYLVGKARYIWFSIDFSKLTLRLKRLGKIV